MAGWIDGPTFSHLVPRELHDKTAAKGETYLPPPKPPYVEGRDPYSDVNSEEAKSARRNRER